MLLPALKPIYEDAMIVEDVFNMFDQLYVAELRFGIETWGSVSSRIEELIPRVGQNDLEVANDLLKAWREARDEKDDFRVLLSKIEYGLLPALINALKTLYSPIELTDSKWGFEKTPVGFLTVKSVETNRYLHDPFDPMHEAAKLANRLYKPDMDSFHILGVGLGYLAYSLWNLSEKSIVIHIYEDDKSMIEYAYNMGVLSWIDSEYLVIEDSGDIEKMLHDFVYNNGVAATNRYVSDWKTGKYDSYPEGKMINSIDYNDRICRADKKRWIINTRENKKKDLLSVGRLKKDFDYIGRECVIVSAGPSLNDSIDFIRNSKGNRIIIAINTVLKRLADEMIKPDIIVALDSLPVLYKHIEGVEELTEEVPLVIPVTASRTFVKAYRGPIYVLEDKEDDPDEFKWLFGGTVASLGIDVGFFLQSPRIYLIGSDLAYPEGQNYAAGLVKNTYDRIENRIAVESSDGSMVFTDYLYNAYRVMIEEQIAAHPETQIINMARHGAKIHGTLSPTDIEGTG